MRVCITERTIYIVSSYLLSKLCNMKCRIFKLCRGRNTRSDWPKKYNAVLYFIGQEKGRVRQGAFSLSHSLSRGYNPITGFQQVGPRIEALAGGGNLENCQNGIVGNWCRVIVRLRRLYYVWQMRRYVT